MITSIFYYRHQLPATSYQLLRIIAFITLAVSCTSGFALSISGMTTVCPGQTYTYSVAGINSVNATKYFLIENGVITDQGTLYNYSNTFTVTYSGVVTSARLEVNSYFPNSGGPIVEQTTTNITKRIPIPRPINGNEGKIIACSQGEEVSITSLPGLGNNPDDCYFHCSVEWSAPSGWNIRNDNAMGNPLSAFSTFDNAKLIVPGGLSRGFAGPASVTAYYINCNQLQNTSTSKNIWYGTGDVVNATVNGSPAQNNNNVSNSTAFLAAQSNGATTFNWTMVGGNGTIYQTTGLYCQVYVNGFIMVQAQAVNRCGLGDIFTFRVTLQQGRAYTVYPNPAKDEVSVDFENKEFAAESLTGLDLYNEKGEIVKSFDTEQAKSRQYFKDEKTVKMNVSDLPRGTYFMHVNYGDEVNRTQVMLN